MKCPNCGSQYNTGDEICSYCGHRLPVYTAIDARYVLSPGTILQERYEITEEPYKEGGQGLVYFALDRKAEDKPCVVKQVKQPVVANDVVIKLREEAKRMAELSRTIGGRIAEVLEDFVEDGRFYVVQQRIFGRTLQEVFEEEQPLNESDLVRWSIQCCKVLHSIHEMNHIHRDISPDNLMLTAMGDIMFIDFGTLRELQRIAQGTMGMAKVGFSPPEQWNGKPVPQSDIFALGATIYNLLTGFRAISKEYEAGKGLQPSDLEPIYPPIRSKNNKISVELEQILCRALELDVSKRYASADEMRIELEKISSAADRNIPPIYCPKCGQPNDAVNVYCQNCLAILYPGSRQCPKGHINPVNARFCKKCGAPMPTS